MTSTSFAIQPHIARLGASFDLASFDCGTEALNVFLRQYATQNQKKGSSQTWLALSGEKVAGYYTLTVGQVIHAEAPALLAKGMPHHPIPVMILARLAVDMAFQGQRLGQGMLKDAIRRTLQAADIAGIRAILVHAKDDKASAFYRHFGFSPFPQAPLTLYRLLKDFNLRTLM